MQRTPLTYMQIIGHGARPRSIPWTFPSSLEVALMASAATYVATIRYGCPRVLHLDIQMVRPAHIPFYRPRHDSDVLGSRSRGISGSTWRKAISQATAESEYSLSQDVQVLLPPDHLKIKNGSDISASNFDMNGVRMQAGMWRDLISQGTTTQNNNVS